jgi:hypothetical protein
MEQSGPLHPGWQLKILCQMQLNPLNAFTGSGVSQPGFFLFKRSNQESIFGEEAIGLHYMGKIQFIRI